MTPDWNKSDIEKWNRQWWKRYWSDSTNIIAIIVIIALFVLVNFIAC